MWDPSVSKSTQDFYDEMFRVADVHQSGQIQGKEAVEFLCKSQLPLPLLKQIWELCDSEKQHFLTVKEFYVAMRFISMAQMGEAINMENYQALLDRNLPLPKFAIEISKDIKPVSQSPTKVNTLYTEIDIEPFIMTAEEEERYRDIFETEDEDNDGFIQGVEAVPILQKSGLSRDLLRSIWNIADSTRDNKLDVKEFIVAMHLTMCKAKRGLSVLPEEFPTDLFPTLSTPDNLSSKLYTTAVHPVSSNTNTLDCDQTNLISKEQSKPSISMDDAGTLKSDMNKLDQSLSVNCATETKSASLPASISDNQKKILDSKMQLLMKYILRQKDVSIADSERFKYFEAEMKIVMSKIHDHFDAQCDFLKTNGVLNKVAEINSFEELKTELERSILDLETQNKQCASITSMFGFEDLDLEIDAAQTQRTSNIETLSSLYEEIFEAQNRIAKLQIDKVISENHSMSCDEIENLRIQLRKATKQLDSQQNEHNQQVKEIHEKGKPFAFHDPPLNNNHVKIKLAGETNDIDPPNRVEGGDTWDNSNSLFSSSFSDSKDGAKTNGNFQSDIDFNAAFDSFSLASTSEKEFHEFANDQSNSLDGFEALNNTKEDPKSSDGFHSICNTNDKVNHAPSNIREEINSKGSNIALGSGIFDSSNIAASIVSTQKIVTQVTDNTKELPNELDLGTLYSGADQIEVNCISEEKVDRGDRKLSEERNPSKSLENFGPFGTDKIDSNVPKQSDGFDGFDAFGVGGNGAKCPDGFAGFEANSMKSNPTKQVTGFAAFDNVNEKSEDFNEKFIF